MGEIRDKKKKVGGRKKGTPNKKTLLLQEVLEEEGLDPIRGLVDALADLDGVVAETNSEIIKLADAKAKIYLSILDYIYPKRKAIEHSTLELVKQPTSIQIQWADEIHDSPDASPNRTPETDQSVN